MKRLWATWKEPPINAADDYGGGFRSGEVVLAADYDSLLAVLRKCVEAMDDANVCMEGEWGSTHIALDDALAAAREILDKEATK